MAGNYNGNAVVQQISDAVAMDPKLKGELYARYLETSSQQHNAYEKFTSAVNPKSNVAGGIRSVFAKRTDLRAGGADTVNFNVIGAPGGPGVQGNEELTGKTSKSLMKTYPIRVGWHRDAIELTKDQVEFLSAGRSLVQTQLDLLSMKMGILKQNHMMMRLIKSASGNVYRPNNRASLNALLATDTLSLAVATSGRPRLRTLGGKPLMHKLSATGSPIDGFLVFASEMAMLPIRNDDSFQTAISNGDNRGGENANFSGELLKWQGNSWYEFPVVDMDWDDYIGCPILPKMKLGVAFSTASASGDCKLVTNASNTDSRYTQFMGGYDYKFTQDQTAAADASEHYAWIVNPDGSVGFVAWTGSGNNGNQIVITKILSHNGAGTSTKGATTVGELSINTTADPDAWTGGNSTLPVSGGVAGAWVYTNSFVANAMVFPANAKGVTFGRSFIHASMGACFAHGRIDIAGIEQTRDFGFTIGRGFEMIFGTGVTTNALGKPAGYLLVEHAVEHEGYPTPSKI